MILPFLVMKKFAKVLSEGWNGEVANLTLLPKALASLSRT